MEPTSEVLFIGGRSGAGKSSVAYELHALLSARRISHAVVEGDNLDLAYPAPWAHRLAERNLTAIWANYRALGYRRLIYTNTDSVRFTEELAAAMGGNPRITAVLLSANDATASARLSGRIHGSDLQEHLDRSRAAAVELEARTPHRVARCPTDGRCLADIAADILDHTGWAADPFSREPAPPR